MNIEMAREDYIHWLKSCKHLRRIGYGRGNAGYDYSIASRVIAFNCLFYLLKKKK